ncbi:ribosome maturation factor RimP [Williamsia deligens]|uniref:Ribosome maturation factor RimP n=1 Tax=Williamsia deligens TaxID=321325 RepID=A0ABW3GGM8_9NOCA|nr:ribosome maturation factor RimP [Williamsia deligens]MCP2195499.1 ribosome maturation factor RimP [Williamsia deligens]
MSGDDRSESDRQSDDDPGTRVDGTDGLVAAVVTPVVAGRGIDLEAVELSGSGNSTVVRIVVDADDGAELDDLAALSRLLSEALDAADPDPLGDRQYTLEVTSPGVDRPLTAPRHWRRAQGRRVSVEIRPSQGAAPATRGERLAGRIGRLVADGEGVEIVLPARRGSFEVREVSLADVASAVVGVDFSPPGPTELALCGLDGADTRREGGR